LAYHSSGAFSHDEIYEMPSSNRRYFLNLLLKQKEEEKSTSKQRTNKIPGLPTPKSVKRKP